MSMDQVSTAIVFVGAVVTTVVMVELSKINNSIKDGCKNMAGALQDIKDAMVQLNTSVSAELGAIATKIAATQSTTVDTVAASDLEPVVQQMRDLAAKVDAETAILTAPPVAEDIDAAAGTPVSTDQPGTGS